MPILLRATYAVRQIGLRAVPLVALSAFGALAVVDAVSPFSTAGEALIAAGFIAVCVWRLSARKRAVGELAKALADMELAVLVLMAALTLIARIDGSLQGPGYAAIYALMVLIAATARPAAVWGSILALLALEVGIRSAGLGASAVPATLIVWHVFLATAFAAFHHFFLRVEIARVRARAKERLEAELSRMQDAARSYRLLNAPRSGPLSTATNADEERLARSSVEEIHQAILFSLDLLRRSLNLHTALLLWLNDAGTHLRVAELCTEAKNVLEGPFLAGDGVLGAALAQRAPVSLSSLRPDCRLPYYAAGLCPARAVIALPVCDQGKTHGLLVVDRTDPRPFSAEEEELLNAASRYALRAIQNERVFIQLERAKVEQGKLYRAAEALGGAVGEEGVVEATVKSVREVAAFDFAAVTLYDPKEHLHEIRAVSGDGAEALLGAHFFHNTGLVAMAIQNKHPLPYKGEIDQRHPMMIFAQRLAMPSMPSVLVLPLMVHDRPLGTLVLGAKRRGAFGDAVRPTLEVLARHVAVSLSNARMVKKLEELATTDGLTGLLNKRALLELAEDKLAAASRFKRKFSVLVTDIDLFKRVNDTHGHDIGDTVIKGLASVLKRAKRTTDSVSRFGGEEFVILCEETDEKGALQLAERIRDEFAKKVFPTPKGPLRITCSLGVATFPQAGTTWEQLFKSADEALYTSKRNGRNLSTAWTSQKKISAA